MNRQADRQTQKPKQRERFFHLKLFRHLGAGVKFLCVAQWVTQFSRTLSSG